MRTEEMLREIGDDVLERHVRARLTPELVEYVRRLASKFELPEGAPTSAEFGYRQGVREGKAVIREAFEGLLSESLDPEKQ